MIKIYNPRTTLTAKWIQMLKSKIISLLNWNHASYFNEACPLAYALRKMQLVIFACHTSIITSSLLIPVIITSKRQKEIKNLKMKIRARRYEISINTFEISFFQSPLALLCKVT